MRIFMITLFSLFAVGSMLLAAFETCVAVAFIYVLGTMVSAFLAVYFYYEPNMFK